jgi:hypothetical protein
MEKQILQLLIPGVGLISGLIATYVSLQNRALLAEVRKELAELEHRLYLKINGTYMRRSECQLKEALTEERLDALVDEMKKRTAAGG